MDSDITALFAISRFDKFGERLEALRKSKNLSQHQLCLKSRVSKNSISAYECLKRNPRNITVNRLAKGLELPRSILEDRNEFYQEAALHLRNFDAATGKFSLSREE
ncbi:MAG: helix-turn-helix transcriptional regulator [Victivallales bacterium]|nr:helix-turn-helix transcriptional regulator [Victivallales bacterium]